MASPPAQVFTGGYVRRVVDAELDEVFGPLPAVLLDGPKGAGKTATAKQRARTVRRLDIAPQAAVVDADPYVVAIGDPPILIDEWQRVPAVWDAVRRLVDDDPAGGRFLLTGSPPGPGTHSGAGRIATIRMRPLTFSERFDHTPAVSVGRLLAGDRTLAPSGPPFGLEDYVTEIIAGGFPGMRHLHGRALIAQLDGYLDHIVDHDLPEAGFTVRRPETVRSWMRAYAAATATTASWETIRDAATSGVADKPARRTTAVYTDLLSALRVLDPIPAWQPTRNHLSRLTGAPKHHLADPALAARLLDRTTSHLLAGDEGPVAVPRDGTLLGALFESMAALSVRTFAQAAGARTYHLRTEGGRHEIDLILEREGGVVAIEVKFSPNVDDTTVRHLQWLANILGDDLIDMIVITTGPEPYRRRDGIGVIPLGALGP